MGVECVRSATGIKNTSIAEDGLSSQVNNTSMEDLPFLHVPGDQTSRSKDATPLGHLPTGRELEELIHLYFASVHRKFFAFIDLAHSIQTNEHRFWFLRVHSSAAFQSSPRPRESSTRVDSYNDRQCLTVFGPLHGICYLAWEIDLF